MSHLPVIPLAPFVLKVHHLRPFKMFNDFGCHRSPLQKGVAHLKTILRPGRQYLLQADLLSLLSRNLLYIQQ